VVGVGSFPLGAFAALFISALPASEATSSLGKAAVIGAVIAPVPVATILKAVRSGKRRAEPLESAIDEPDARQSP
jgi:hypothetical protein